MFALDYERAEALAQDTGLRTDQALRILRDQRKLRDLARVNSRRPAVWGKSQLDS